MVVKLQPITNPNKYMKVTTYDKDEDGVVDKAEAIREVDTLPETVKVGEVLLFEGHYYVGVRKT